MLGFVKDLAQDMDVKADYQRLVTERDFQYYQEHVILSKLLVSSPAIPNF
jgi:predicted metal-dependent peptidase